MSTDSTHRTNLRIAVAGVVLFGAVVAAYGGLIAVLERAGGGSLNARALTMLDYLPEITSQPADRDLVMLFGSSMVQAGFDPLDFDAALAAEGITASTYNYGLGNLNPRFQELLTRRIREAFERDGRRLSLALIEFNPFQTTVVRNQSTRMMDDQNIAIFSNNRELWQHTLSDPSFGARLFVIRYFRKGYSAELLTSLPQLISGGGPPPAIAATEEFAAAQRRRGEASRTLGQRVAADNYPPSALPGWDPALRGGRANITLFSGATLEALADYQEAARHPLLMQADLHSRVVSADILELGFDETLIVAFIEMVRNFQAVAESTEVLLLPRHAEYVVYSQEVQARLDTVKQRIAAETGARVRDYQLLPSIDGRHFSDSTHMNSIGTEIFTRRLAADYVEVLRQP